MFAGGELASRLIAFTATAYLAVVLGPEFFGLIGFAFAVVSYLTVVVDVGFSDVGSRQISLTKSREEAARLAASATVVRVVVAVTLFALLLATSPLLESSPEGRGVINLTGLLVVVAALDTSWVYKGLGRSVPVGISLIVRRLLYAVFVFGFIRGPEDILAVPVTQVVGEAIGVLWLAAAFFGQGGVGVSLREGWRTFRSAGPLLVSKLLRTSVLTLDVVLLGILATNAEVGVYSALYRLCFLVMAIAGAIQVAYLPHVTRSVEGQQRSEAAVRHFEVAVSLGLPIAIGGSLVAAPVIELIYGAEYVEGAAAFRILLASVFLLFVFSVGHNLLLASGRLAVETRAVGVAAVLNLALNLWWIPAFGITGAAWATLVAEGLILAWVLLAVRGELKETLWYGSRVVLACGAMVIALVGVGLDRSIFLTVPVGALTFGVALTALRGLPKDAEAAVPWRRSRDRTSTRA